MWRLTRTIAAAMLLLSAAAATLGQAGASRPAAAAARTTEVSPIWAPATARNARLIFIRQRFGLSADAASASIRVAASCPVTLFVDGQAALTLRRGSEQTTEVGEALHRGRHVLAFECARSGEDDWLTFALSIRMPDGRVLSVVSNGDERAEWRRYEGWEDIDFADARWPLARIVPGPNRPGSAASQPAPGVQVRPKAGGSGAPPDQASTSYDASRIVRVWNLQAGIKPGDDVYASPRLPGDRMILSTNVPYPADFPALVSAGFTLFQTDSDHLSSEETSPGVFDFARPDANLAAVRERGLDWCYSPHFAVPPPWYSASVDYTRVRCLEHDRTIDAFSPWEPKLGTAISRGYARLADRYNRPGGVSALDLGVYGDYGEAGAFYGARTSVAGQRENWEQRFGNLHDHIGWWCGDALAREDFRTAMLGKYGDLAGINAAWKTDFRVPADIVYPKAPPASSRRCWLDFVEWYQRAFANLTDAVCAEARRDFPHTLLMVPVGFPSDDPRYGCDASLVASVAAKHGVALRSAHAGLHPFAENQAAMLGRLASAARFYGTPFWTEPPGKLTAEQETSRIFEALSQGATGLFDWSANVRANRDVYYRLGRMMQVDRPVVDVAMYYPTTSHLLHPDEAYPPTFLKGCTDIRDALNYDIVDERMIQAGALSHYRLLVMWEGTISEKATLDRIKDWVEAGGTLVAYDFGKIETVEGDRSWFKSVFGYTGHLQPFSAEQRFVPETGAKSLAHYRLHVADRGASEFLSGDWREPESAASSSGRWTGARAQIRLPVMPGRGYVLTIRATLPANAAAQAVSVSVNGRRLGPLASGTGLTTLPIPQAFLTGRGAATVTIAGPAPAAPPARGRSDQDRLGAFVETVDMDSTLAPADAPDPGPPAGRFETALDLHRLKTEWAVRLGRGWTVYFPATRAHLRTYCDVVRYLTYHLSDLDPTKADAVAVDDQWDGLYATLMSDRVLYYNPGPAPVTRHATLSSASVEAARGLQLRHGISYDVTVEPNSIAVVPFGPPKPELLLQCEKFTELGSLRPQRGGLFSPGSGPTHMLVPRGGSISTRFRCGTPGRYNVFVRAVRRGATALADVLVDGRPIDAPLTQAPSLSPEETRLIGSVSLDRGVHALTVRPLRSQDVRADYVVLTTDPTIAGYTFAVRP